MHDSCDYVSLDRHPVSYVCLCAHVRLGYVHGVVIPKWVFFFKTCGERMERSMIVLQACSCVFSNITVSLSLYIYIYIYMCVCVCVCVCVYVWYHICICICTFESSLADSCEFVSLLCIFTYTRACMHACLHISTGGDTSREARVPGPGPLASLPQRRRSAGGWIGGISQLPHRGSCVWRPENATWSLPGAAQQRFFWRYQP